MDMKKFFYRVEEGETVLSVSKKFNIPFGVIIFLNKLKGEIEKGDLLYLEKDYSLRSYTVGIHDTIQSISEKFGISPEQILQKNNIPYLFYGLTIII